MGLVNFSATPVLTPEQKKNLPKGVKLGVKSNKSGAARRRPLEDSVQIYGDELFKKAYIPQKAIVVGFHPFDKNMLRMDKEGKFAIQYFKDTEDSFLLYYFQKPIENYEYVLDPPYLIHVDENVKTYGPFNLQQIRDKIIGIIKREFLEEKENIKKVLFAQEAADRLAKEKAENDAEIIAEQLGDSGLEGNIDPNSREASIVSAQNESEEKIPQQTEEETTINGNIKPEIRTPTTEFLREDKNINPEGKNE